MSCVGNVCGTGGWTGPLPGDPDNNVVLRANAVYGGIDVSWTYPATNPAAVIHTLLFRATEPDLNKAVQIAVVAGSIYYDKVSVTIDTDFYYWIRIVSVNGTTMDPVGPASATGVSLAKQTLESLTGMIDAGQLAQDLKTNISGITANNAAIYQEIRDRLMANSQFAALLADVQSGVTQAMTFVNNEVTARQEGDNAVVTQINTLAAANAQALAAIDTETTVRVSQHDAMTQQITSLITTVGDNSAGLVHDLHLASDTANSAASDVETLATTVGDSNSGLIHSFNALSTTVGSLATDMTTVEASLNGNTSTGQIGLITKVGDVTNTANSAYNLAGNANTAAGSAASAATAANNLATSAYNLAGAIGAEYFVKLEVNGLIGGFGVYNDGVSVQAGFDVDVFWVGRSDVNGGKVKPFIIAGGNVYIANAFIQNAAIDTLKVAGSAITGLSASTGGGNSIVADGSTTLLYTSVSMPDSSGSGIVVTVSVAMWSNNDASAALNIQKNGNTFASTGVSLRGGYVNTYTFTALDMSPNAGSNNYSFNVSNNISGPGSNQAITVNSSSIVASGSKR